ncbi:cysteine proteinase, partial [Rhizodiscina lignyota]
PSSPSTPAKKEIAEITPLQKLLADSESIPVREDGSDKYFGMENFGSTCYCNSIVQCLYYSTPFREQVISFPTRSPYESLNRTHVPRVNTAVNGNAPNGAMSPAKPGGIATPNQLAQQKAKQGQPTGPGGQQQGKPEDNKDSPEYKKKQAMAAGPHLTMDYENSTAYNMPPSLFTALKDIFEAVIHHKSRMGIVSPYKFLEILRRENEMFRTPMHQDAHEFLNLLLNEVVENVEHFSQELRKSDEADAPLASAVSTVVTNTQGLSTTNGMNNIGWVHELFEGTLTSETRCLTCENTSHRDEAFLDLSVDLEQHSSVTSCLRKFSEEEMLCERNKFHCDNCGGLQEAEKRMKIKRLPRILALHLKRFKYTEDLQRLQKLFHRVVYPYYLRLFNTTDDAEDPDRLYELYAVVVHIGGGPYHGHYVSIIKTQDRGWLLFDDEMVEPVDKSYVRNFFGGENVLACAYVLFYQETTLEAMQKEQDEEGREAERKATEGFKDTPGKTNGTHLPNGYVNHAPSPSTPTAEEGEIFASLDHAATAPVQPAPPVVPAAAAPLEPAMTSPGLARNLTVTGKKSDPQSKKERQREEKERKAAEKAAQKANKAAEKEYEKQREKELIEKRKEMEKRRQDNYKRQEEEMKAAIAASKETYKLDREKTTKEASTSGSSDTMKEKEKENGIIGGGLNRFRPSSMTIRGK